MHFAAHQIAPNQENATMAPTGSDANLWVEFYTGPSPLPDPNKSDEAGFPVYVDVPWVKILVPGDRTKSYDRPAKMAFDGPGDQTPPDPQRFPQQWSAYKSQSTKANVGLPIEEWAAISRSEAQAFKRMDIHTVEQLAGLTDTALSWLGARQRRDQAKAWLESAKDHAGEARLAKENEQLKAQVEALADQVKELSERLGESVEPARRGPGRPRKDNV